MSLDYRVHLFFHDGQLGHVNPVHSAFIWKVRYIRIELHFSFKNNYFP